MTAATDTIHCDLGDHEALRAGAISVRTRPTRRPLIVCEGCRERYLKEDELRANWPEAITEL